MTYTYDGDGRDLCTPEPRSGERDNLVKSVLGDVVTYYIGKHYEKQIQSSQQNVRKYYFAGANRIAMLAPQGCSASLHKERRVDLADFRSSWLHHRHRQRQWQPG